MKDREIKLVPKPVYELSYAKREEKFSRSRVPRAKRYEINAITRYRVRGEREWYDGVMKNISISGVLIGAVSSLPLETVIEMRFALPVHLTDGESAAEVQCRGSVVRSWKCGVPGKPNAMIAARIIHSRFLRQKR
jgi:hypothetical protein